MSLSAITTGEAIGMVTSGLSSIELPKLAGGGRPSRRPLSFQTIGVWFAILEFVLAVEPKGSVLLIATMELRFAFWGYAVTIYRLIAASHFGPEEIEAMTKAYEVALAELCLVDRNGPITDLIARAIVNVTTTGERAPQTIKDRALSALGIRRDDAA
jgi:hypothetical protein